MLATLLNVTLQFERPMEMSRWLVGLDDVRARDPPIQSDSIKQIEKASFHFDDWQENSQMLIWCYFSPKSGLDRCNLSTWRWQCRDSAQGDDDLCTLTLSRKHRSTTFVRTPSGSAYVSNPQISVREPQWDLIDTSDRVYGVHARRIDHADRLKSHSVFNEDGNGMSILFSFHIQVSPGIDQMLAVFGSRFIYIPDLQFSSWGFCLQSNGSSCNTKTKTWRIPQNSKVKGSQGNRSFFCGIYASINYDWGELKL
jgi:hypothetical protein